MDDTTRMEMVIPLDSDGFVRRECPTCERELKWLGAGDEGRVLPDDSGYYCPYCGVQAPVDSWWTKPQIEYAEAIAVREIVEPGLKQFQDGLAKMARQSGGFLKFKAGNMEVDDPVPLVEPDDMQRVVCACHPTEPVKVADDWTKPVYCIICGVKQ
jgi:hypothetical protein